MKDINDIIESCNAKPKKRIRIVWVFLAAFATLGTYAAMFIPALNGNNVLPQTGTSSLLWSGVLFALLWRYRSKNGWVGFLLGAIFGIFMFILAAFIGGYVRASSGI